MTKIIAKEKKTKPPTMKKENHESVTAMIRAVLDDDQMAEDFEKHVNQRQIVKNLMALRAAAQISQQGIAAKLKCTQSRISKLENSTDYDLRLGDLAEYARALGFEIKIVLTPVSWKNGPYSIEMNGTESTTIPPVK